MALRGNVNKDIRSFEPKVLKNLTKRQVIWLLIGTAIVVPCVLALPFRWDDKIFVGILMYLPFIMCGTIKMERTPLEIIFIRLIYKHLLTPKVRVFKINNRFGTSKRPAITEKIKYSNEYKVIK